MKKINSFLLALLTYVTANAQIDTLEFPIGYPGTLRQSAIEQLQACPVPRFKKNHTLLPNVNWMDLVYFGGWHQPGNLTDHQVIINTAVIQRQLAGIYNYMVNVTWFDGEYNDTCVAIANAHPEWKVAAMTLRAQTGTKFFSYTLPDDHYLQNAQGQFTGWSGEVAIGDNGQNYKATWRPTTNPADYSSDGDVVKDDFLRTLKNLTHKVDLISEDGEVYPVIESGGILNDPACVAEMNQLKITWLEHPEIKWAPYLAYKVAENDKAYSAKFRSIPQFSNAKYTEYGLSGSPYYEFFWQQSRLMQSKINNQYYSTEDFYVRYPWNWKDWYTAWHGLRWFSLGRYYEMQSGDKLFSPFVAAGWDCNEENNVRPAQWLGLLKILGIWGAEFYYSGYFTETQTPCEAANYAWQAVIPAYAQAVTSQYEDVLRNGTVMDGDIIDNGNPLEPTPKYQFSTGDANKLVMARKKNSDYIVLGIIENSSNTKGATPLTSTATFTLDGESITLPIARQGKTFWYNKTNKTVRLLDGWHEYTHPTRWSNDISIEAENSDVTSGLLKTYFTNGSTDWTKFKTVLQLNQPQTAGYSLNPRTSQIKYLFVKIAGTGVLEAKIDSTVYNFNVGNEGWYVAFLGNMKGEPHTLTLKSYGSHEIDSICVTNTSDKYPVNICIPPSAVISASNPKPCAGDSVILSANFNIGYQWNTGATTQSIVINSNGAYTVTVSNTQCTSTSQPYNVVFSQCADCPMATGLYNSTPQPKSFYLYWNRVAEANQYIIYIADVTNPVHIIYLPNIIKVQKNTPVISKFIGGLTSQHKYSVYISVQCATGTSKPSATINVTTKTRQLVKL